MPSVTDVYGLTLCPLLQTCMVYRYALCYRRVWANVMPSVTDVYGLTLCPLLQTCMG